MGRRMNGDIRRLHFFNAFNYGAARIAVRRERLTAAPIRFSLDFGGGAKYSAGRGFSFIRDMLQMRHEDIYFSENHRDRRSERFVMV